MHIQEVFNAMFKNHHYEYLIVNQEMEVIEFSDRVIDYCDAKLLRDESIDLYALVPEFYGLEVQFEELFSLKRDIIEIPHVRKKDKHYLNISVQPGRRNEYSQIETLVVLFENVTEFVIMHQRSVQDRNEKELLLFQIEKKNLMLHEFNEHMMQLVEVETNKNMKLSEEIIKTQQEVIATMGAIGETRSKETGDHVLRVAEYSRVLGLMAGLNKEEAEALKMASPLHDIGKVGIEDAILNKPDRLSEPEAEIMKTHARIGYDMLRGSNQKLLQTAAIVAHEHHEKWNGEGYPRGLKGEEIHIYGRITAICDVFDALGHERIYKKAWPLEDILTLFRNEHGKHFDPNLIDLFIENLDTFLEVKRSFNGQEKGGA